MRFAIVAGLVVLAAYGCARAEEVTIDGDPGVAMGHDDRDPGVAMGHDAGGDSESDASTVDAEVDADPTSQDGSAGGSCESKAVPLSTSDSCSFSGHTCPDECGGGHLYGCPENGAAPVGLADCYTFVVAGTTRWTCCPARACTRHAAYDGLCSGKRAFFCPSGETLPGCTPVTRSTLCCP